MPYRISLELEGRHDDERDAFGNEVSSSGTWQGPFQYVVYADAAILLGYGFLTGCVVLRVGDGSYPSKDVMFRLFIYEAIELFRNQTGRWPVGRWGHRRAPR